MMMTPPRRDFRPERFKGDFTRAVLLELSDMTVEAFDSLRRRGQVPLIPTFDKLVLNRRGVPIPDTFPEFDARGWSPFMALALILANDLVEQYTISRERAAYIARHVFLIHPHGPALEESSKQLAELRFPMEIVPLHQRPVHIVLALITDLPNLKVRKAGARHDPSIVVGSMKEIVEKEPTASGMVAVSMTAALAKMRKRAAKINLDLTDFLETVRQCG